MKIVIRPATAADTDRLGAIHVLAWQAAYRGVMPDAYLDALEPAQRAAMWRQFVDRPPAGRHLDVVTTGPPDDDLAGFACYGPAGDTAPDTGELYAVNLDPARWGRGLGTALVGHVADRLRDDGFTDAVLWVVPANTRARAVYERLGWCADGGAQTDSVLDATVEEIRYRTRLRP